MLKHAGLNAAPSCSSFARQSFLRASFDGEERYRVAEGLPEPAVTGVSDTGLAAFTRTAPGATARDVYAGRPDRTPARASDVLYRFTVAGVRLTGPDYHGRTFVADAAELPVTLTRAVTGEARDTVTAVTVASGGQSFGPVVPSANTFTVPDVPVTLAQVETALLTADTPGEGGDFLAYAVETGAPGVTVTYPTATTKWATTPEIPVTGGAPENVQRLELFVNGALQESITWVDPSFERTAVLTEGVNTITVLAYTTDNEIHVRRVAGVEYLGLAPVRNVVALEIQPDIEVLDELASQQFAAIATWNFEGPGLPLVTDETAATVHPPGLRAAARLW